MGSFCCFSIFKRNIMPWKYCMHFFHPFQEENCCMWKCCEPGRGSWRQPCWEQVLHEPFPTALPAAELSPLQPSFCHLVTGCPPGSLALGPAFSCVGKEQIGLDCNYLIHFTSETHAPGYYPGPKGSCRFKCPEQPALPPTSRSSPSELSLLPCSVP